MEWYNEFEESLDEDAIARVRHCQENRGWEEYSDVRYTEDNEIQTRGLEVEIMDVNLPVLMSPLSSPPKLGYLYGLKEGRSPREAVSESYGDVDDFDEFYDSHTNMKKVEDKIGSDGTLPERTRASLDWLFEERFLKA